MSATSFTLDGLLKSDGTLELDVSPPLLPGRVRVTLQRIPAAPDDDLDWGDLDYDSVPFKRIEKVAVRIEQRGRLKPMPHDLDDE